MTSDIRSIAWQQRRRDRKPVLIKNGLEEPFSGSATELVHRTRAITLISRDGAEVQVSVRRTLGPDSWEGEVLRAAPTSSSLRIGALVSFEASHIQGGTV